MNQINLAIVFFSILCFLYSKSGYPQIGERLKEAVQISATKKMDEKIKQLESRDTEPSISIEQKNNENKLKDEHPNNSNSEIPTLKSYQNYDFVPGDKIIFEDNFTNDQNGEFPSSWDLESGQAVVNIHTGTPSLFLTEGNYVKVAPRMKTSNYLTDPFTIEFDYYPGGNGYGVKLFLECTDGEERTIEFSQQGDVTTGNFPKDNKATFPSNEKNGSETYYNRWHHIAVIYSKQQIKCYVDQYRTLVVPNAGIIPTSLFFGGTTEKEYDPIILTHVRIAEGGKMNIIGKKYTDSKIITHGITFDYNKAILKPESMGTLKMIVELMKENPTLKFEVGGHTDEDGDPIYNLKLSQQRAETVKKELINLGISGSRLQAKGYGTTMPIDDNKTLTGKANNRRVEFSKIN